MTTEAKVAQIGLDGHRTFSNATARDGQGRVMWRQRLEHRDRPALAAELGRWPAGTPVVLEATFGWGWLSDELADAGLEPHLASSKKVAAWREARGIAKSNRTDADLLSELEMGRRWWEVWWAPAEVRDRREWMRYRMTLVQLSTGLKNRIHAVLHRHGIVSEYSDLFGRDGRAFLELLVAPGDATLCDSGRAVLAGYLKLLRQLRDAIAEVTRELRRQLERHPAARRLRTLPGIAWILAYTIVAEVGRIERFKNAKHLASYSLLAPRSYDSGDDDGSDPKGRHVGHAGRRTLKWAWIQAAHGAVRSGGRFREIFDRVSDGGKKNRGRAYIAVAHELCRVAYVLWKQDRDWSAQPPPRPGQEHARERESQKHARQRDSQKATKRDKRRNDRDAAQRSIAMKQQARSGTGQPDHPMVAALTM